MREVIWRLRHLAEESRRLAAAQQRYLAEAWWAVALVVLGARRR